jgi:seryl-tRNA synthetase
MIEIQDFIKERGGDPEKIRESQRRRNAPVEIVDEVIELFEDHRRTQYEATQIGTKLNEIQKQIGQKKKAKQNADELIKEKEELGNKKKAQEDVAAQKFKTLCAKAKSVGNYVHDSVPISNTEDDNALIKDWKPEGATVEKKDCLSHHEVLWRLGGYDSERAVKIVGHRGYCLTGMGLFLNCKTQGRIISELALTCSFSGSGQLWAPIPLRERVPTECATFHDVT